MAFNAPQEVTPEALVDLLVPHDLSISPTGKHVVYSCSPIAKAGDHTISSLWIAEIDKKYSARQITSGLYNDTSPQWFPVPSTQGDTIAFVSDRSKQGESSAIYLISLDGGEPYPVTKADNKKKIASFKWSPNGRFIAFVSPDEKSAELEDGEKETGGVKVYGQDWEYNRLRSMHVATREISTLYCGSRHVTDFAWKEDSSQIAFTTQRTPELESNVYHGVRFERVALATRKKYPLCAENFPGPASDILWLESSLLFLAGATPKSWATSSGVYRISIKDGKWSKFAYGETNCARKLRMRGGELRVLVSDGLSDQIHQLSLEPGSLDVEPLLWYELNDLSTWDSCIIDQESVTVVARTSGEAFRLAPTEVHSVGRGRSKCQLSQLGEALAIYDFGRIVPLKCKAEDGTVCDAIFIRPSDAEDATPLPTLVLVHGGPYERVTVAFNLLYYYWAPYLVSAGYAVLCPNYRGGIGHGEYNASQARGGMGTTDYGDVIALLKAGISKVYIDEHKVAIGGWSQGGFLSYLAVTRSDFQFKAAVCGAGITDWDMMSMSSDAPRFEAELAGVAPWETTADDTKGRQGSPIWHMKNAKTKTPILILHGEQDTSVPLSQALAFQRGCMKYEWPCEMIVYPREGHMFSERKHVVDMLKRIRRFYDTHLR